MPRPKKDANIKNTDNHTINADNGADKSQRQIAFEHALESINKRYGDNTILRMDDKTLFDGEVISTGSISLDKAIGVGGVPRGRIIEVFGDNAAGKTSICLHIIASSQKSKRTIDPTTGEVVSTSNCVFIDMEHALEPIRAKELGVDLNRVHITQPDTGEQALEIAEELIRSGSVDVIVVDSVSALVPRAEIEGSMGDSHVGLQARLMSQGLRKIVGAVKQSKTCVIFTNQLRENIGMSNPYGPKTTTSGGRALKFYASLRMEVSRIETLKKGEDMIGTRIRVKIVKNKVSAPFRQAEFDFLWYENGISRYGELLDIGVEMGVISKRGAYYKWTDDDGLLGQGKDAARDYFKKNPDRADALEKLIRYGDGTIAEEDQEFIEEPEPITNNRNSSYNQPYRNNNTYEDDPGNGE